MRLLMKINKQTQFHKKNRICSFKIRETTTNPVILRLKLVHVEEVYHLWALNPQYHTYDKDFEYFHHYQILICKEIHIT